MQSDTAEITVRTGPVDRVGGFMELREALTQITEIRLQMARTEVFRGYRAVPAAFSGAVALSRRPPRRSRFRTRCSRSTPTSGSGSGRRW